MRQRPPPIAFPEHELIVDNFAGGGGASHGIQRATGRSPDIAVNHDPEAIAMHATNHPTTRHLCESVWVVDPVKVCAGRPVGLAWFSPDCKHFSRAKGGKPVDRKVRGLADVAVRWARRVRPRVIMLENVPEFLTWGPLHDRHTHGCTGASACRAKCLYSTPIKERRGESFLRFVGKLRKCGYVVEWRKLRASLYGAPTTRERLFLIARRDGEPIAWPEPTHGPGRQPLRSAAECIDWSIPCPSIFDRARPLADATCRRIARGIEQFVHCPRPFVIPLTHQQPDRRAHDLADPSPVVTGAHRGELALVVPYMVHQSNGERVGQAPRTYDVTKPAGTAVAGGIKQALVVAWLAKHYGGHESKAGGTPPTRPIDTITARDHHTAVAVHLTKFYGTSTGSDLAGPSPTVTSGGTHTAQVCAFLTRYNGTSGPESLERPLGTLTARDRYALALVTIDGETYQIVDIGMRMLTPRELARCQGFPDDYAFAPGSTKTAQVRLIGNSVCPDLADALVRANAGATCAAGIARAAAA